MNSADQFETIVSNYYEPLFRFAMSLTRMESDARDLTQQTFYIWAKKGHQLRDISKVKTWLFTTLHRTFLEARRRQIRFPHQDLDEIPLDALPASSAAPFDAADSGQVLWALAQLDDVYQAAVALFYLEDCPYKDIAEILEVPLGTVKSRIARGVAQLREILLSDGSRDSSDQRRGIPSIVNPDKSAPPSENTPPCARHHAGPVSRVAEGDYDDWDFSSTYLGEPFGTV